MHGETVKFKTDLISIECGMGYHTYNTIPYQTPSPFHFTSFQSEEH